MSTTDTQPVAVSVAVATVLMTGVTLAAILIPELAANQALQVAIIAFGNALIGLAAAVWARARVTPLAAPKLEPGTTGTIYGTEDTFTVPTPGS
jgi:hypothetical protein